MMSVVIKMFSKKWPRITKYALYGSSVGAITVGFNYYDADYNSFAFVRVSRTALTAMEIGLTYQRLLYSKELDKNSEEYRESRHQAHTIGAQKLLNLCQINKGVYVKVGQHIGALEYLLPHEYVQTMKILHKDAPKNSVEDIYKVISEDLSQKPEDVFSEFDPEPLGTASLAQVHKAKLHTGQEVAVKVQHCFVKDNINVDIIWMERIVHILSAAFPNFQMQWLVDETKKNIAKELNFLEEASNAEQAAELFSHYKWLKVPKLYREYCTGRVLVMEYVEGGQINNLEYIEKHNINKLQVCQRIGDLYSDMIFVTGFIHSDPHPGNILLKKEPNDNDVSVYLLDHGLYAQLTDDFRYHYSKLWLAIINREVRDIEKHATALGLKDNYGLFACMVTGRSWNSIMQGIGQTKLSNKEKEVMQEYLPVFLNKISECLETVDRQALLVLKTNDLIRSIEYTLGVQDMMPGFLVMTQSCTKSVYKHDYASSNSAIERNYLRLKYYWSSFLIYLYSFYMSYMLSHSKL